MKDKILVELKEMLDKYEQNDREVEGIISVVISKHLPTSDKWYAGKDQSLRYFITGNISFPSLKKAIRALNVYAESQGNNKTFGCISPIIGDDFDK